VTPNLPSSAADAMKTAQVAMLNNIAAAEKHAGSLARLNAQFAAVEAESGVR